MKDNYGDKITVRQSPVFADVVVTFNNGNRDEAMILTAQRARRLARKINQAASAVEIAQEGRARV